MSTAIAGPQLAYLDIGSARNAYRIFGDGPIDIVIEGALNSSMYEWTNFCAQRGQMTVLCYDRAGYGESSPSTGQRNPDTIVDELDQLLCGLEVRRPIVLVGHSQGGLYATLYALKHKEAVKRLILLDPLSVTDSDFKSKLTKSEYQSSGVDKTTMLKMAHLIASWGLAFLFKGMLKKAPPFYYCAYEKDDEHRILKALLKKTHYRTALAEYMYAHDSASLSSFSGRTSCGISLIRHSPAKLEAEIVEYGGTSPETAKKIEVLWQEIMRAMLKFGSDVEEIEAVNSSHYIHLTEVELVWNTIHKYS